MAANPLTEEQRTELSRQLERFLDSLGGDIASDREDVRDNQQSRRGVQDRSEESFAGSVAAVDRAMLRQHEVERREVQAAIARMRDGTYGECMNCGEPIGYARLQVAPAALRCMRCQERAEAR